MVMQAPVMPFAVWLVMFSLTLVAVWACSDELRRFAVARPLASRFAGALVVVIVGAVALGANPLNTLCDWQELMDLCGGWELCAWAAWYGNACWLNN